MITINSNEILNAVISNKSTLKVLEKELDTLNDYKDIYRLCEEILIISLLSNDNLSEILNSSNIQQQFNNSNTTISDINDTYDVVYSNPTFKSLVRIIGEAGLCTNNYLKCDSKSRTLFSTDECKFKPSLLNAAINSLTELGLIYYFNVSTSKIKELKYTVSLSRTGEIIYNTLYNNNPKPYSSNYFLNNEKSLYRCSHLLLTKESLTHKGVKTEVTDLLENNRSVDFIKFYDSKEKTYFNLGCIYNLDDTTDLISALNTVAAITNTLYFTLPTTESLYVASSIIDYWASAQRRNGNQVNLQVNLTTVSQLNKDCSIWQKKQIKFGGNITNE